MINWGQISHLDVDLCIGLKWGSACICGCNRDCCVLITILLAVSVCRLSKGEGLGKQTKTQTSGNIVEETKCNKLHNWSCFVSSSLLNDKTFERTLQKGCSLKSHQEFSSVDRSSWECNWWPLHCCKEAFCAVAWSHGGHISLSWLSD